MRSLKAEVVLMRPNENKMSRREQDRAWQQDQYLSSEKQVTTIAAVDSIVWLGGKAGITEIPKSPRDLLLSLHD
jgi:hypothetical protein